MKNFVAQDIRVASASDAGLTLRRLGRRFWPALSSATWRALIAAGRVRINDQLARLGNTLVISGDRVSVSGQMPARAEKLDLTNRWLWESDRFALLDKPPGLTTDQIESFISPRGWKSAHRLDRWTSGALLIAKGAEDLHRAQTWFRRQQVVKHYLAILTGRVQWQTRSVQLALRAQALSGRVRSKICPRGAGSDHPKAALTHFAVLARGEDSCLVQCRPVTGRTHQIRVHAAWLKHPVLGDCDYGINVGHTAPRQMLHAHRLSIPQISLNCTVEPPGDFLAALDGIETLDGLTLTEERCTAI